ncbi:T9SS type A sorting domain-containing protein [Botryobacter ruber]|uniref:T9SS type A sorting domain-containing protein n=1 Tax=Botryobacter ruber TaxID=2171629 RepID=UPI000E0B71F8|nr:T9SS type A sorting domain-containing protein [Botryobacter ruber]
MEIFNNYSVRKTSALTKLLQKLNSISVFMFAGLLFISASSFGQGVSFSQWANEGKQWVPGILNPNNSQYYEGTSTLQRLVLVGIPTNGTQTLKFKVLAKKADVYAYDYVTGFDQAFVDYQTIVGSTDSLYMGLSKAELVAYINVPNPATSAMISGLYGGGNKALAQAASSQYSANPPGPAFGDAAVKDVIDFYDGSGYPGDMPNKRAVELYGSEAISSASLSFDGFTKSGSDTYGNYTLTWNSPSDNVLILMAGHLSVGEINTGPYRFLSYGTKKGSSSISGGPYHFKLETLNGASLGNQDNQIQAGAINPPPIPCPLQVPIVTITEPTICGDGTGTLTVCNPHVGATYTLTQDTGGGTFTPVSYESGTLSFTGLVAGKNFNLKVEIGTIENCVIEINCDSTSSIVAECTSGASASGQIINGTSSSSSLQSIDKTEKVTAYPVPFSDKATIEFKAEKNGTYEVNLYDITGNLIKKLNTGTAKAGEVSKVEVDGRNLSEGMYFIRIENGKGVKTIKLLKKNE